MYWYQMSNLYQVMPAPEYTEPEQPEYVGAGIGAGIGVGIGVGAGVTTTGATDPVQPAE